MNDRQLRVAAVGPQKTATSWLYACLKPHPELCFPLQVKETFFFDERWDRGWDWYWSHFRHCSEDAAAAEVAPTWFDVPEATQRLLAHNPRCRIIISLRDPVERAYSLWLHHRKKGRVGDDFREAVEAIPRILDAGRYSKHVPRWLEAFGIDQVHILFQDDIRESPETVLEAVYDFLEIDRPETLPEQARRRVNTASLPRFPTLARWATRLAAWFRERRLHAAVEWGKRLGLRTVYRGKRIQNRGVPAEIRAGLLEEFREDIAYVEDLTGRSRDNWRSR